MTTERQLFEDATYNEDGMTAWEVWQAARADRSELLAILEEITGIAERVDSWQSFPSDPIERARAILAKASPAPSPQEGAQHG